jgi:hypothetical protein
MVAIEIILNSYKYMKIINYKAECLVVSIMFKKLKIQETSIIFWSAKLK